MIIQKQLAWYKRFRDALDAEIPGAGHEIDASIENDSSPYAVIALLREWMLDDEEAESEEVAHANIT